MHDVIDISRARRNGPCLRIAIDVPLFDPWWFWRLTFRAWFCR